MSSHSDLAPVAGRTALVLFGSETGNAQDLAEELARLVRRLRFSTLVCDLNSVDLVQLVKASVVFICISTTGQGDLPANALTFWKRLRSKRLQPGCLKSVQFTTFGLGDSSYLQCVVSQPFPNHADRIRFNWASRKLYNRLIQLGAQPFIDRGESDEQHPEGIDGTFLPWYVNLPDAILKLHPLSEGVERIPDDVLLRPPWELELISHDKLNNVQPAEQLQNDDLPPNDQFPIADTFSAAITANDRLTPSSHWQDVRHVSFSLPHRPYEPGDVLVIHPKNFPSDVSAFLALQGWDSVADLPVRFRATVEDAPAPPLPPAPSDHPYTIRSLLTNAIDIMAIPRRSFFSGIAHYTTDEFQRERLVEFTDPQYVDELYDYTTRPRRSILEVLQEFETVRLPWERMFDILPRLRGRQFSIASGGSLKSRPAPLMNNNESSSTPAIIPTAATAATTRVDLLIAIVKYRTVIKRIRQGVCTRYIASLQPGTSLAVSLQPGSLHTTSPNTTHPSNPRIPIVMIGPGTGVAPMRALIYERVQRATESGAEWGGTDLLFYGCRNEKADFFYRDEWTALRESGKWKGEVFAAFSRDQRVKVYVQDLVRREAEKVYEALGRRGGVVYICGYVCPTGTFKGFLGYGGANVYRSSGKMPQAVREALIEVFQSQGELDREGAEAYLIRMEKTGRYKQETW